MHLTNDSDRILALAGGTARIKPFHLAEQDVCITGTIPLRHMHRLRKSLLSRQGEAQVSLRFGRGVDGSSLVAGEIRVRLALQCQRCLQPVATTIAHTFELMLARDEAEARRLQAEHDVLELVEETIAIKDLVEDELLLAVPLAPSHEDPAACDATMLKILNDDTGASVKGTYGQSPLNPFAVLKSMKGLKET